MTRIQSSANLEKASMEPSPRKGMMKLTIAFQSVLGLARNSFMKQSN
jgi:hypothetical protein